MKVQLHELPIESRFRYFITVDGKVTSGTAAAVSLGEGVFTEFEARRKVQSLQMAINVCALVVQRAEEETLNWDNRHTVKLQRERLARLIAPYQIQFPRPEERSGATPECISPAGAGDSLNG